MLDFLVYLVYRAGTATLAIFPLRVLFYLGNLLGFGAWLLAGKYRRLARRNLEIAFGSEKAPAELNSLARRHFQRLGANFLASIKLTRMSPEQIMQHVAIE